MKKSKSIILDIEYLVVTLAGIELRYLVNHISEKTQEYYVSNIYGITKDSILFKLHHPEHDDVFLMLATTGMWITSVKLEQMEQNRLVKRLRNDLIRLKLKKIEQLAAERIAYLTFSGFDKEFVLVIEFFGDGNIILCNNEMKILALQHSIDVRHRKLGVGLSYLPPPENGLNIFDVKKSDFNELKTSDLTGAKWLGRTLGLPKKYVEGIFKFAKIDTKIKGSEYSDEQIDNLCNTTKSVVSKVISGEHEPIITSKEKKEALPIRFELNDNSVSVSSFMEGLDSVFTESLLDKGKSLQSFGSTKKIKELQNQLSEQEKAIELVKEKSTAITSVANSMFEMISQGITSITESRAKEILNNNNSKIIQEKGLSLIVVKDEKIKINVESSLQSIASTLFNEAKHQSDAIKSIEAIRTKTGKKLEKLQNKSENEKNTVSYSEVRKKNWFERYRWFFTSDEILAIGGRDASSNSAIIRKHLEKNDIVFHAEIFGSPFFIMKERKDLPAASLNEIAHATVCFSRAWRESMYGMSAYWVNPDQVKKSAPSGQFLPKGSFTIEGQRNFVKISTLKLAVGIIPYEETVLLSCGPLEPIKKKCILYAIIEPGGIEMVDAAKKIRQEFLKLDEKLVKQFTIDEFVRILPAGQTRIIEISRGDVKGDFVQL